MADRLSLGIDIGQRRDPSCMAVVETIGQLRLVRYIQRLPLGTTYPKVAKKGVGLLFAPQLIKRDCLVRIDCTGVGLPVVDLVREYLRAIEIEDREIELEPLVFRYGETYNRASGTIGKMYLVSNLQTLLQQGLVQMDENPETQALKEELLNYEIRVSEAGKDVYGVFRTGKHDDMATALALACLPLPPDNDVPFTMTGSRSRSAEISPDEAAFERDLAEKRAAKAQQHSTFFRSIHYDPRQR